LRRASAYRGEVLGCEPRGCLIAALTVTEPL
jgi:hypothetical protein